MSRFSYRIVVEWSETGATFVARVPAFEGCTAHGDTEADAARQARVAATAIIEVMKKRRQKMPPSDVGSAEYSGQLRLRLPRSLHERLARLAAVEETSLNQLLVGMLSEQLGRKG